MPKKLWDAFVHGIGLSKVDQLRNTYQIRDPRSTRVFREHYAVIESDYFHAQGCEIISSVKEICVGGSTKGIHSRFVLEHINTRDVEHSGVLLSLSINFDVVLCKSTHNISGERVRGRVAKTLGERAFEPGSITYERIFLRHKKFGEWYALVENLHGDINTPFEMERYVDKEDYIPSIWSGNLPSIGYSTLETFYRAQRAGQDFKEGLLSLYYFSEEEEKKQKEEEKARKEQETRAEANRVALALILANLLVDRNLSIHNEVTKEDITRLVKNGLLELEDLNLASLSLQELVDEIVDRIPEDQKEAFIERTQELLNVST